MIYIKALVGAADAAVFLASSFANAMEPVRATKHQVAERNAVLRQDRCVFCRKFDWKPSSPGWLNHGLKFEEQLDDRFFVAYEVNDEVGTVDFAITARSEGWIGWGPTDTGGMMGGNPCVVQEIDGVMTAVAMHSLEMGKPIVNKDQNCELLDYSSGNGETYAKIRRPIVGCAPEDLTVHNKWALRFMAAWGDSQQFSYHGDRRAYLERNIRDGPLSPKELPDDAFYLDVFMNETELPAQRDVYYMKAWKMPDDRR
jgi:hypothetical protein